MQTFEIQLAGGKVVTWQGTDGEDACRRCADGMQATVIAWRVPPIHFGPVHPSQIIG